MQEKGYYVGVGKSGMSLPMLEGFVRTNMMAQDELLRLAREAELPEKCEQCERKLTELVAQYYDPPAENSPFHFKCIGQTNFCYQCILGACQCAIISRGLREIVHRDLAEKLSDVRCDIEEIIVD